MKLAFVVQRYGADIAGGSEAHCRELARRLAADGPTRSPYDITVLTTCAADYVTWANVHEPGEFRDGDVRVRRFRVRRPRRLRAFAEISDEVFDGAPLERQEEWFRENGPDAPDLIEHLASRGGQYDLVLFWTFRYATTYFGLPHVAGHAILVPTAEEDAAIRLDVLKDFFGKPAGFLFLTPEERALVEARAGRALTPARVIGMGLDPASPPAAPDLLRGHGIDRDYVLYLGRVDRNKGCHALLEYFDARSQASEPLLVLAGPRKMTVPEHRAIRALGYVSNELRDALLAHALALVVPSPYESLSIALLEGWNRGVPAIVNGHCRVLDGQVRRANAGLPYRSAAEFDEALTCLTTRRDVRDRLGRQGLAYVEQHYRWPAVIAGVEGLLTEVLANKGFTHSTARPR